MDSVNGFLRPQGGVTQASWIGAGRGCNIRVAQFHAVFEEDFMGNPFVHVELNTTDVQKAKDFYGKLFDWKMSDIMPGPGGAYTMIEVGEGTGGGLMKHPIPGAPSTWLAYVLVDDIAAATQTAKSLGASVVKDVTEVPRMGWFSIILDPTGAALGLWQSKST